MTPPVHIELPPDQRRLVLRILDIHLPRGTKLWVFGSRATGRARRYSDLDLAIDAGRPLTLDEIAGLTEAFSDSDLPYKVDLIDCHNIGRSLATNDHGRARAPDRGGTPRPITPVAILRLRAGGYAGAGPCQISAFDQLARPVITRQLPVPGTIFLIWCLAYG